MRHTRRLLLAGVLVIAAGLAPAAETVWLSELDLNCMTAGWGRPRVDKSIQDKLLSIAGQTFARGVCRIGSSFGRQHTTIARRRPRYAVSALRLRNNHRRPASCGST